MPLPIPLAHHIPTLVFIITTVLVSQLINRTQPTPYIDEIFHIPQAQRYCAALSPTDLNVAARLRDVEYDAKLTTPPGLYVISLALAKVLPGWECNDVVWLRSTNLVLLLTLPVLIARIMRQNTERTQPKKENADAKLQGNKAALPAPAPAPARKPKKAISRRQIEQLQAQARSEQPITPGTSHDSLPIAAPDSVPTVTEGGAAQTSTLQLRTKAKRGPPPTPYQMTVACTVALLPPLWFFGFLYYTDVASVWLVLACITLYNDLNSNAHNDGPAMAINAASIMAVLVRQTNVVWVMFAAAQGILSQLLPRHGTQVGLVGGLIEILSSAIGVGERAKERRDKFWRTVRRNLTPLTPMLLGCAWFVKWNGSIVLGDKANHQAGLHFPQLGYLLVFATGFGAFSLIHSLSASFGKAAPQCELIHGIKSALFATVRACFGSATRIASFGLALSVFYAAVDKFTIDHPFLLADNRHYTFYIWRLFRRTYTFSFAGIQLPLEPRFAVIPLYVLALFAWCSALTIHQGALSTFLLLAAIAATLIPTPLIEPRYYLIPYVLLRIYIQPAQPQRWRAKWLWLALELAPYAVVNMVTVALFFNKPFQWPAAAVDTHRGEATVMRFIW